MKLATWNINSIRARTDRLIGWLAAEQPDVLCLQETKVEDVAFPLEALREGRLRDRDLRAEELQRRRDRVARSRSTNVARGFGDDAADERGAR